jgi:molybdopterin converting factor small subunit
MKVLFFGTLEEIIGQKYLDIPYEQGMTIFNLFEWISDRFPKFRDFYEKISDEDLADYMLITIDGSIVNKENLLKENDLIKIFLPLSGG